jgi:glyoxylase-like metal-dependent hydrolase (beta-lactamase superfamily II)
MTLDGTNTWLLGAQDSKELVLVDPGPKDAAHLEAVNAALQARDSRITAILLTHGHLDHSEGARLFGEALQAPVHALDPAHRYGGEGLNPGQVIARGDLEIEVVATPGHSSDSMSFSVRDAGIILTGDTVLGRGTTVVANSPMDVVAWVYQPIPDAVIPAALASVRAQWDYINAGN